MNVVRNTLDAQGQARAWQTGFMSRGLTALGVGIQTVLQITSVVGQRNALAAIHSYIEERWQATSSRCVVHGQSLLGLVPSPALLVWCTHFQRDAWQ